MNLAGQFLKAKRMLKAIDYHVNQSVNIKQNVEVGTFFQILHKLVIDAKSNHRPTHFDIDLAKISIRLSFFGNELRRLLLPALLHISHSSVTPQEPKYQIYVLDGALINSPFPAIEDIANKFIFRGDIEDFSTTQHQIAYLIHSKMICAVDHTHKIGIVIAQDSKRIPKFTTASPLKEIFNWIMLRNQCSLIHAAAIGNKDGAVLLTGKSGAGKSITAIRCLFHGFDFFGDDIVGISNKNEPFIHSIFATAKIFQKDCQSIADLRKYVNFGSNNPKSKEVFFLGEDFKKQLPMGAPIKAILHLVQNDGEANISPTLVANVLNVVGSTSFTLFPYSHQRHTMQLISLFKSVPCYRFELGNQVEQIAPLLEQFLESTNYH